MRIGRGLNGTRPESRVDRERKGSGLALTTWRLSKKGPPRQIRGPLRLQRLGPCARCAIVDVAQGQGKAPGSPVPG